MNTVHLPEFAEQFPRPDMRLVNDKSVEIGRGHMESLCRETIDIVYDGVSAALEKDKELFEEIKAEGFPSGSVIGSYVKQDTVLTAPTTNGAFTKTFYTRLEPDPETLSKRQRTGIKKQKQYLHLHIPAGDLDINHFRMPPKEEVSEVYVEFAKDDYVQWYGISRTGLIYEYEPPKNKDIPSEVPGDDLWQDFSNRVPNGIRIITEIFQDVSNWRTIPQDLEIVHR